jgi:hypothetical protein
MKWITSVRLIAILTIASSLAACGLGETAATSAAGAASEAQQAKQARATEQQVQQKVEAAMREDAAKRAAAEKQGE